MHQRFAVAFVVALRNLIPSENIFADQHGTVGEQHAFVASVVVDAQHLEAWRFSTHEPLVFLAREAIVEEVREHVRVRRVRVEQIEREKAELVDHRNIL